jgi:hypothetical protein
MKINSIKTATNFNLKVGLLPNKREKVVNFEPTSIQTEEKQPGRNAFQLTCSSTKKLFTECFCVSSSSKRNSCASQNNNNNECIKTKRKSGGNFLSCRRHKNNSSKSKHLISTPRESFSLSRLCQSNRKNVPKRKSQIQNPQNVHQFLPPITDSILMDRVAGCVNEFYQSPNQIINNSPSVRFYSHLNANLNAYSIDNREEDVYKILRRDDFIAKYNKRSVQIYNDDNLIILFSSSTTSCLNTNEILNLMEDFRRENPIHSNQSDQESSFGKKISMSFKNDRNICLTDRSSITTFSCTSSSHSISDPIQNFDYTNTNNNNNSSYMRSNLVDFKNVMRMKRGSQNYSNTSTQQSNNFEVRMRKRGNLLIENKKNYLRFSSRIYDLSSCDDFSFDSQHKVPSQFNTKTTTTTTTSTTTRLSYVFRNDCVEFSSSCYSNNSFSYNYNNNPSLFYEQTQEKHLKSKRPIEIKRDLTSSNSKLSRNYYSSNSNQNDDEVSFFISDEVNI